MAMDILTLLIVGLVAGVLASFVVKSRFGLLGDIVVGIVGSFVGSWLFRSQGWNAPFAGLPGIIFIAFIGAIVLLVILRLIRRA
ncbi:MAG TPA: GlsB/YeaQ/YmgE family stress response membrane protein [Acidobacteria bacterium]|nr:GlsB/YeaQ/YmgE family stress response membrane protein [Acidobacteriota bacterium]